MQPQRKIFYINCNKKWLPEGSHFSFSFHHFLQTGIHLRHRDLQHNGNLITERLQLIVPYVCTAYSYRTLGYVIKAGDQLNKCGF